jgi:hypothetical protein
MARLREIPGPSRAGIAVHPVSEVIDTAQLTNINAMMSHNRVLQFDVSQADLHADLTMSLSC